MAYQIAPTLSSILPQDALFAPHEHRNLILAEVHARPFRPIETPQRLLHFAFLTNEIERLTDEASFSAFCLSKNLLPPHPGASHHRISFDGKTLGWERHSEFTSYSWSFADSDGQLFHHPAERLADDMRAIGQPGRHLASIDLQVIRPSEAPDIDRVFSNASLCVMTTESGLATVATDFQAGANGFVRILLIDRGLTPIRAGALTQRLLELETYRLLALLGLPEAHRLGPSIRAIEESLVGVTRKMTQAKGLEDNQRLLDQLAELAAELEAGAAESLFRFGASRAYQNIVQGRLNVICFEPVPERETFAGFLSRRMAPALQTCATIEERQNNLSRKLARATQLLRTQVDIELERQNRDILIGLRNSAQMQLRLQRTVEGLSIAAASYYVVGLLAHAAVILPRIGIPIDPDLAAAISIPFVIVGVSCMIAYRLRKHAVL